MLEAIKKRRASRKYLMQEIDEKILDEILNAALFAPSANHIYPWDLVVIKDDAAKEKLAKLTPWATHLAQAPVVIAVVGYPKESSDWVEDCSIVAEHIWLEAVNQGFSSCWTQIRGNKEAELGAADIINSPEESVVLCLLPIGAPAEDLPEHSEQSADKSKIKKEKFK